MKCLIVLREDKRTSTFWRKISNDTDRRNGGKASVVEGETSTGSVMAYGYNPTLSDGAFHGAIYAVMESIAKVVAMVVNVVIFDLLYKNILND